MPTLESYFNDIDDPGTGNAPRHKFVDLMTISLLCALCGGETAVDMETFGHTKEDFLRDFLELLHGVPCHDAYSRLFRLMKPSSFKAFSTSSALILPLNKGHLKTRGGWQGQPHRAALSDVQTPDGQRRR